MARKVRNRDNNFVYHVLYVEEKNLPQELNVVFYKNNNIDFFEVKLVKREKDAPPQQPTD